MVGFGARDRFVHEIRDRRVDRAVDDDAGERLGGNGIVGTGRRPEQQEGKRNAPSHAGAPPMPSTPITLRMSSHTSRLSPGFRSRYAGWKVGMSRMPW